MSEYQSFGVEVCQDVAIVALSVDNLWDRDQIQLLRDELLEYVRTHKPMKMILNMGSIQHISSETITTLMKLRDQMVGRDAELGLCSLQHSTKEILRITELTKLFKIYDSPLDAFKAMTGQA